MKSSNRPAVPDGLIHIGKIIGVHGLNGTVKVYSYAESAAYYAPPNELILMDEAGSCSPHKVKGSQEYKNLHRLSLMDIRTRDDAEALVGQAVLIPKADLPPLDEDTYYWADLLDMAVFTCDDEYLGQVTEIIPTGANDVYVVNAETDTGPKEILIPALATVVLEIDIDQRRMRVDLPEGLT